MVQEGCIVLEGGAFRGLYGEGVLDALMQENINLRCTIGVSAGAMNGLNYVSGQMERSIRMNLKYRHDKRYVGRKALQNSEGLIGFAFAFPQADQEYPFDKKRFFQFDRRFIAVATNCETAEPVYFEKDHCRDIFQAVQASAAMPFISKMVWLEGYPYLDGGCSDKIPFAWALREGYKNIIVVRTRPLSYRKKTDSITRKLPLEKTIYRPYPKFIKALKEMDANDNRQCEALELLQEQKRIYVIAPSQPVTVGRLVPDLEKLGSLYWMGDYDTRRQMQDIRRYLKENGSICILQKKDLYSIWSMLLPYRYRSFLLDADCGLN